jgi:3D (Asp-Asp-Asp) domain-containing protein/putative ubiquitin-RnfH superfamily antitoxin RatB of RatAB toxin-antitoxin module
MKDLIQKIGGFFKRHLATVSLVAACFLLVLVMTGTTVLLNPVTIDDGGRVVSVATFSRNRDAILAKLGIELQPCDVVTESLEGEQPYIHIERSFPVTITANGNVLHTLRLLEGSTVADALKQAGIAENTYDLLSGAVTDVLSKETTIAIVPYEMKERDETEIIPHDEDLTFTNELPAGARKVTKPGVDGKAERVIQEYYKDGELVTSIVVKETITEPVTEFALVGNGSLSISPIPLQLDENGRPVSYKSVLTGDACAYYFKKGTKTATGTYCKNGVVAVNPEIIPYGTKMFIVADDGYVYGYAEARDTGIAVRENIIIADLFMESYKQTCQFGRRHVSIYILE